MFKKKPQIKPLSPLRSSDRRKTAEQIIADLGLQSQQVPDDANEEQRNEATAAHTALRNALLPDNALSARFTTTQGPDLKQVSGTIYVGNHEGGDQRILWFKVNERMFPTVYTLWRNPGIIPLLHTNHFVMPKLRGGADLMTPGLSKGPPFPSKAVKGAIVAIASTESPSVPLVVGTCEIDVNSLQQVQGLKGHAVETAHWAGDELWAWSPSGKTGLNPPDNLDGWCEGSLGEEVTGEGVTREEITGEEVTGKVETLTIEEPNDEDGGASLTMSGVEVSSEQASSNDEDALLGVTSRQFSPQQISWIFHDAFLYGIYHHMKKYPSEPNYGLNFPLSQSKVLSTLIQPFLPAFTPEEAHQLQIKKSNYRNIKRFIRELDRAQIIKSKERDGNEVVLFDVDFDDRRIQQFVPYRLPEKKTAIVAEGKGTSGAQASVSSSDGPVKIKVLYRPKDKLEPLFSASKSDPRAFYNQSEIGPMITAYAEAENLISTTNKRLLKLNPWLANVVLDEKNDRDAIARGSIPRDALITVVVAACSPYHQIGDDKPKAGAPPKITITMETRSGNKTVTKVSGLEAFQIAPQPLADELRKICAGSTSVEKMVGSAAKNPVMEVMVQGPQKDAIIKVLEKKGIDRRWTDIVDKTKKKK